MASVWIPECLIQIPTLLFTNVLSTTFPNCSFFGFCISSTEKMSHLSGLMEQMGMQGRDPERRSVKSHPLRKGLLE